MPVRSADGPRHGIARVISKNGFCSRSEAARRVRAGRVTYRGRIVHDPETPVSVGNSIHIHVDGMPLVAATRFYLALNKPRGLVTTASDEKGRRTVYDCFDGSDLPWIAPVGRLDQASEGLLLFSNDPEWAARITGPSSGIDKIYHVQVAGNVSSLELSAMQNGVEVDSEIWSVKSAVVLRAGERNTWLAITLDEGKNRQIRRILTSLGFDVLRLVRVAIGDIQLGQMSKGSFRFLTESEINSS